MSAANANIGSTAFKQNLQGVWDLNSGTTNIPYSFAYTAGNYSLPKYSTASQAFPGNGSENPPSGSPYSAGDFVKENAAQYLMSASVSPTNLNSPQTTNATGAPRQKDGFILIGAGIDRIYGTLDDNTNFGPVQQ
jgi:hypothetical protein